MAERLTADQRKILTSLASEKGDGWCTAAWIAEDNDHWFDTPWASGKLPGLVKRGFVEKGARGWYRITPAGRAALTRNSETGDGG